MSKAPRQQHCDITLSCLLRFFRHPDTILCDTPTYETTMMKPNEEPRPEAHERLMRCRIRPSAQRVAIMQYLLTHATHPTVDEIYTALCPLIPTLSRTTVYNTLRMYSERGAAQMITIDDHHVSYDGDIRPHAHFICRQCGKVLDFHDVPQVPSQHPDRLQEGCYIDEVQVYFKGLCGSCLKKKRLQ